MNKLVDIEKLSTVVKDMTKSLGVTATGIATRDTLKGGPPSADITYVLPEAKSAVCFALPLDMSLIEPYLLKKDYRSHVINNIRTNTLASGIALEISNFLNQVGYKSVPVASNLEYRKDPKKGYMDELPPLSHRYLAVRSGVGYFGFSGNIITDNEGAAIILASVVTEAELIPTDPLPEENNYCDDCRLCNAACASGFMNLEENTTVSLGGIDFSYSKRRHHNRCDYVCGGFTGLHKSGKWSTWSPGRFPIPEKDEDFLPAIVKSLKPFLNKPSSGVEFYSVLVPGYKIELTCGNCQLICHPDKKVRNKRYKMLIESGVVIQNPDGSRESVTPDEAIKRLAEMNKETKSLYELN